MKSEKSILALTLAVFAGVGAVFGAPILPFGKEQASSTVFSAIRAEALDKAAEEQWLRLSSRSEYDSYRLELRRKMFKAMGVFPERTPLEAKVVGVYERDGYRIEKVIFWSMPGVPVTANLFIPSAKGPHPAVVMSCGHSPLGKDAPRYLRACVIAAKRGFVALMFDPYEQGERQTCEPRISTRHHNQIGLLGELLDWSMPLLRIWDGMRAIDYIASRPEVDPNRIGYMGQSGGGTMTALIQAADSRVRAAAPSCYLTRLGTLCATIGPQDAEQNIFGQLAFGLNHTGYALIPDIPVAVTCKTGDMFDYRGTLALFDTVSKVERMLGVPGRSFLNSATGPHGWSESTETSSVEFLAKYLLNGGKGPHPDIAALRELDFGFNLNSVDVGLAPEDRGCLKSKSVTELPGYRSIYDIIAERARKFEASRSIPMLDSAALAAKAIELAVVRKPSEVNARVKRWGDSVVVLYPDGETLPAEFARSTHLAPTTTHLAPSLIVDSRGREKGLETASKYLAEAPERTILVADVSGVGEVGWSANTFYGAERSDEALGAIQYLIGEPLVGKRATDMLVLASWLKKNFGVAPMLVAEGPLVIPAAHAYAADRSAWSAVEMVNLPPSWKAYLAGGISQRLHYADLVPRAYSFYDWPELLIR